MKKIISLLLVCALTFCFAGSALAAGPVDGRGQNLDTQSENLNDAMDIVVPRTLYYGTFSGNTTGSFNGTFTVPSNCSGKTAALTWSASPIGSANKNAVFKITVNGNSYYVPANGNAAKYTIGKLNAGTYSYSVSPYSSVSGEYSYALIFYTPDV